VNRQSRLLWRCRRGIREMDLLLEMFVSRIYPELNDEEQECFDFLQEADPVILNWIMGRSEPGNPVYTKFVRQLQTINTARSSMEVLKDDV